VRRLRLFPRKCLVDGELLARLDGPLELVKKPERIVAAIAAGDVKGERSMGVSRACADGGVGSLFAIDFKPTAVRKPNLCGVRRAPRRRGDARARQPMGAVHINKPALSAAERLLIERLARMLPVCYAEADKFVNESSSTRMWSTPAASWLAQMRPGETAAAAAAGHRPPLA
jgi:hypothetical protein